jgi:plastocyanin
MNISRLSLSVRLSLAAVSLAVAGCSGYTAPASAPAAPVSPSGSAAGTTVTIRYEAYSPKTLKIKVGTTVRFVNKDDLTHTVTANDNSFGSPPMSKNHAWKHAFTAPGKYAYHCKFHPFMTGIAIVTK